jgi:tetratricopeptide (TPR) repeat protein
LSIRWLRLPTSAWSEGPLAAQTLWGILIETQAIQPLLALLQSSQGNRFVTTWNSIVTLTLDKPDERRHSQSIANVLKNVLFDNAGSLEIARDDFVDEHEYESNISYRQDRPFRSGAENRRYYKEAQANIRQIVACIKTGEDDHARRYIEEFATKQVSRDDAQYAVKTLCSIGQKCNHILRYDMERTCLEAAISIDPDDAFALVQIGDHYKRVRQFERAAELLFRAKIYAERETALVVESSLADLQSVQGNYETAISMYMTIPGWESQIVVRTAIADCLRASGDFKGAKAAYLAIVEQWGPNLRVSMGIAELLKAEGELEKSLELYNQIVESTGELTRETWENDRELRIAWLSQINVLKRLERYQDAQLILERLKLLSPDDMTLRANLAVIYGLLGRSMVECLREVGPVPRPTVAHDWLRYCIRGLLQLKNGQTGEARNSLIARWDLSKHNNPDDALRLAAATAFLQVGDLNNATRVLASPNTKLDPFYQYIQLTLEYHVAKLSRNRAATADIQARLQPIAFSLPQFNAVIQAIDAGDFRGANRMVATLLLLAI